MLVQQDQHGHMLGTKTELSLFFLRDLGSGFGARIGQPHADLFVYFGCLGQLLLRLPELIAEHDWPRKNCPKHNDTNC